MIRVETEKYGIRETDADNSSSSRSSRVKWLCLRFGINKIRDGKVSRIKISRKEFSIAN